MRLKDICLKKLYLILIVLTSWTPTDSPATTKLVYTVEEIARMLAISLRSAYNLCNSTTEFRVLRVGGSIRVPKDSFDAWLYRAA